MPSRGTAIALTHIMMIAKLRRAIAAAVTAAAIGMSSPACVVRAGGPVWVVDTSPPPARVEVFAPRPGYVWIQGHWEYVGGRWVWRTGYWVRERAGHVWMPGAWVHVEGRWHWHDGRWDRAHTAPTPAPRPRVRDHR